ncbi:hypothetical protein BpHYR1_002996 [Brachionus plicatilis]|uniref:Uncharacterized protein n=1 Tax=Brachionus plicatilis TaxID=10195 RepID=A0A3M7PJ01_BRAPC|nr:hypothetical protein BpHYR1_002996 [Brachionus plicatilis]
MDLSAWKKINLEDSIHFAHPLGFFEIKFLLGNSSFLFEFHFNFKNRYQIIKFIYTEHWLMEKESLEYVRTNYNIKIEKTCLKVSCFLLNQYLKIARYKNAVKIKITKIG